MKELRFCRSSVIVALIAITIAYSIPAYSLIIIHLAPSTTILAHLSSAVYNESAGVIDGFTPLGSQYTITGASTQDGFGAVAFRNPSDPDTIVIAVRGTDPSNFYNTVFNVVADGSIASGSISNDIFAQDVNDLVALLQHVHQDYNNSRILLTGHSLGGALAQIVGNAAGINVVSFDAPGAKGLLPPNPSTMAGSSTTDLAEFNLGHLAALNIASPLLFDGPIVNYRLYGDQVSLVGLNQQFGTTKTVDDASNVLVDASVLLGPIGWSDQHKLSNLYSRLTLCGDSIVSCDIVHDGAPGPNIIGHIAKPVGAAFTTGYNIGNLGLEVGGDLWSGVTKVAQIYGDTWTQLQQTYVNWLVAAGEIIPWDPPPGFGYLYELQPGSPFIQSLALPYIDPVIGWVLQYEDKNGWSLPWEVLSPNAFTFTTDVTSLLFFPIDKNGDAILNPNSFLMNIGFASDGEVNATLKTFAPTQQSATEPNTLILICIGLATMLLTSRILTAPLKGYACNAYG